jgi:DNA-binding transcriptional LysR family regulator
MMGIGGNTVAAIHPHKLKISQIRALVAIANLGNFSEAALHLDISQSAVSHAIATLEEDLGVVLVKRGRHGAVLTAIGKEVAQKASQVLDLLMDIGNQVNAARGLDSGQVRVSCFRSVATHILPSVIEVMNQKYPGIKITIAEKLSHSETKLELRSHQADIGFIHLPADDEFDTYDIMHDEYLAILPPTASSQIRTLTWDTLMTYPLILGPKSSSCHQLIYAHLQKCGQTPNIAYEVREDSTALSMVERGLGATIMGELAARPIPENLSIYHLPQKLYRHIGAITVADALHSPAVYAFLDALQSLHLQPSLQVV